MRDNLDAYDKRYKLLAPFAPPAASATASKVKKKGKSGDKPFEGAPRFADAQGVGGLGGGVDDAQGVLDVRWAPRSGTVKLGDYERYNPQHLPPSQFAQLGTMLRVSLLGPVDPNAQQQSAACGSSSAPKRRWSPSMCAPAKCSRWWAATKRARARSTARPKRTANRARRSSPSCTATRFTRAASRRPRMLDTDPGTLNGYRPSNYEDSEGNAPMRLREALAHSVNVAAVHVLQEVGPANVVTLGQCAGDRIEVGSRSFAGARLVRGDAARDGYRVCDVGCRRRVRGARAGDAYRQCRREPKFRCPRGPRRAGSWGRPRRT